jgi:hypothetical protein
LPRLPLAENFADVCRRLFFAQTYAGMEPEPDEAGGAAFWPAERKKTDIPPSNGKTLIVNQGEFGSLLKKVSKEKAFFTSSRM